MAEKENQALPITFRIYAKDEDEVERGRKAIAQFINIVGYHGGRVSGDKIAEAVSMLNSNPYITSKIIGFFR